MRTNNTQLTKQHEQITEHQQKQWNNWQFTKQQQKEDN